MKNNIVFCDGGLSNRLNSLIFSLILREKYGKEWEISWPINNWCNANFNKLFSINMNVNLSTLSEYKNNENDYTLLLHENQINFNEQLIHYHRNCNSYDDYHSYLGINKPLFYYNNLIPNFVSNEDMKIALSNLAISPFILFEALNFCKTNEINNSVLGLHIRKTDFGNIVDDESLFNLVKNNEKRFFVCSDDYSVTEKFSNLDNCRVYKKKHYPKQLKADKGWNDNIQDDQNRSFTFNIERSEESIIEALVDLLILSSTTQIQTSHSTFLKMSQIFKYINILYREGFYQHV